MVQSIYNNARNSFADGSGWNLNNNDVVRVFLVDAADYTFAATHSTLADIPSGAREESVLLTSVTFGVVGAGVLDAANPTFTAATGDPCEALVYIRQAAGGAAQETDELLFYDDQATGLPVTLNGGDVDLTIAAGGIFNIGG